MSTTGSTTANVVPVSASTTSASLLTTSNGRRAFIAVNTTGAIAYLRFGSAAATSADYSVAIAAGATYESPIGGYAGPIQVILASGSGTVLVTSW